MSDDADTRTETGDTVPERRPSSGALLKPGDRVGRHTVLEPIGSGSFGQVFTALDEHLKRKVALKVLTRSTRPADLQRFQREGEALAALAHPNVVSVYDVIDHPHGVVLAMEYVEGQTLTEWVKGRPWREVLGAFLQAARGLSAAHQSGMVHRDFKPDNVLVGADGRTRVADFGLATRADATRDATPLPPSALDSPLSAEGVVVGSPYFLAPEVKAGAKASPASDQYSYFRALQLVLQGQPRGEREDQLPPWVDAMIDRGLGFPATRRWPDMAAVVMELEKRLGASDLLDPFRGLRLRRFTLLAILVLTYALYIPVVLIGGKWVHTPEMALAFAGFFLGLLLSVMVFWQRTLWRTLLGLRIAGLLALSLSAIVCNRGLAVLWGASFERTITIDVLIIAVVLAAGALFVNRWMWSTALATLGGVGIGFALPQYVNFVLIGVITLSLVQGYLALRRPDLILAGFLSSEAKRDG